MSTRSKKSSKGRNQKSPQMDLEVSVDSIEYDYQKGLEIYADLLELQYDDLIDYLDQIQEIIKEKYMESEEDIDEDSIPHIFGTPIEQRDIYKVMAQLTELYGFYMSVPDGAENPYEFAKELFVNSYAEMNLHISRKNPTLIEYYAKLDSFRALETTIEGQLDVGFCKICNGKKINVKIKGTRAADEALTVIYTCPNCKASGKNIHLYSKEEKERIREDQEALDKELESSRKELEEKISSGKFFEEASKMEEEE
jgi:hypothetical protein